MTLIEKEPKPLVIGEQLRSGRESLALSIEDVAEQLKIEPGELVLWEENRTEPPLERLWELAEFYERGVDYFLIHTPPMPGKFNFRVSRRQAFREMPLEARKVLPTFDELCRNALELSELSGETRKVLIEKWPQPVEPETLAERERKRMGIDGRPIKDARRVLESQGIWIFELPVSDNEFSGFSWWHKAYGPCILVNASDPRGRRSFTLAHELAHILAPEPSSGSELPSLCEVNLESSIREERYANTFAACFLMPSEDVRREFDARRISQKSPDVNQLYALIRRYNVSLEALVWRLVELSLLSRDTAQEVLNFKEVNRFKRRPKMPTWRRRLGQRYVEMAESAYTNGKISLGKLAQYLRVSPYELQRSLERGGVKDASAGAR